MTPAEKAMHDALGDYIDQSYNNASPQQRSAVGFVLAIYQRRLASSFYAQQKNDNSRDAFYAESIGLSPDCELWMFNFALLF